MEGIFGAHFSREQITYNKILKLKKGLKENTLFHKLIFNSTKLCSIFFMVLIKIISN